MANTYPTTQFPLGSTEVKVLFNNASNFDDAMNSELPSFYDRFNKRRETWAGMQKLVTDFLEAMGFEATHLVYVDGTPLTVLRPTQLIDRAGSVYKVKMPASFPVNLTGTWATDQLLLVDVGDAALRYDLATVGTSMIAKSTQTVNTIAELKLLLKTSVSRYAYVARYTSSGPFIGSSYQLDISDTTSVDDGGAVIVAADGGRWKLIHNGRVDVRQFGAISGTDFLPQITAAVTAIYNFGGGEVWVYETYNCSGTIPMMPMVAIRGPGSGRNARIQMTASSGVLLNTTRPPGYAPSLCIGAKVLDLTLVGTGMVTGGTCISLDNAQQCEVIGNEIALFEVGIYWNRSTTSLTIGGGLGQSYFNKVSRNMIKPCTRGHYFKGSANRNTMDTNSIASGTIGYEFGDPLNISETNTFITENIEGCHSWAEWSVGTIYSQTWVNLCVENPAGNGFVCEVKDPGRQVFLNLSIIPLGDSAAITFVPFNGATPSLRWGTSASSGTNRLGVSINEDLMLYSPIVYAPTQHASTVYTGTVAANSKATISIPLAASALNYLATAYALRSLNGCCLLAYAQAGSVSVEIINPTTSPVTITSVEIAVTVAKYF